MIKNELVDLLKISTKAKFSFLTCLMLLLPFQISATPPALYYSFIFLDEPTEICTQKANSVLRSSIIGSIKQQDQQVSLTNDEFNVVIHCKATNSNSSDVTIMAAHEEKLYPAEKLVKKLEKAMAAGLIEP